MVHELCFAFPSNLISCPTLLSRYNFVLFFSRLLLVYFYFLPSNMAEMDFITSAGD
jgi:hypothetical protein